MSIGECDLNSLAVEVMAEWLRPGPHMVYGLMAGGASPSSATPCSILTTWSA